MIDARRHWRVKTEESDWPLNGEASVNDCVGYAYEMMATCVREFRLC